MQAKEFALFSVILLTIGCSESDCLPEPDFDSTPPDVHVVIEYSSNTGGRQSERHLPGDPAKTIVAHSPLSIYFVASDSSGIRSLLPGITIQKTVGLGVERRRVSVDAVSSTCPRPELSYRHDVRGTRPGESLLVTVVAENWAGLNSTLELLTIRLE